MTVVPTSKRNRIEENHNPKQQKHFFNRLPLSLETLIYSFINISTAQSLVLTNTSFKSIVPNFFVYSPSNFNAFISFFNGQISHLPRCWQTAYEKGFPHLKTLTIPFYCKSENLIENISKASSLQSFSFNVPYAKNVSYIKSALPSVASLSNLTELDISFRLYVINNIFDSFDPIWNCMSLKKLTIAGTISKLYLPKNKQPILPNLTYLNLCISTDDTSSINELVGRMTSIKDLILYKSFVLENETLLKLTNLTSLSFADPIRNIAKLSNLHSLKFITTNFLSPLDIYTHSDDQTHVSNLNAIALTITNLPNLKKFTINHTNQLTKYITSKLDELNNVHINMDMDNFSRIDFIDFDSLSLVKSFSLKIDFDFFTFRRKHPFFDPYIKTPIDKKINKFCALSGLKEIHITLTYKISDDEVEEIFISFLNQLSHLISSITESHNFLWTEKIIKQLQRNKLINCTKVESSFEKSAMTPFSNDEIFQLFPKLTWDNLIRKNTDQYALKITKN